MRYIIICVGLLLVSFHSIAQEKFTVNGYIKDSLSGETLIGASITILGSGKGVSSNQYGYYSLTLAKGNYELTSSFLGYKAKLFNINLDSSKQVDILLVPNAFVAENVTVTTRRRVDNVKDAQI